MLTRAGAIRNTKSTVKRKKSSKIINKRVNNVFMVGILTDEMRSDKGKEEE